MGHKERWHFLLFCCLTFPLEVLPILLLSWPSPFAPWLLWITPVQFPLPFALQANPSPFPALPFALENHCARKAEIMERQKSIMAAEVYSWELSGCIYDNPFIPSASHALVQQPHFLVPRNYAFIMEEINTSKQTIIRNSSIQFMLFQLGPL